MYTRITKTYKRVSPPKKQDQVARKKKKNKLAGWIYIGGGSLDNGYITPDQKVVIMFITSLLEEEEDGQEAQDASLRLGSTKSDSRSGGWKYPFLGGSLFSPSDTTGFFLGGGGHTVDAGIRHSHRRGVAHPSWSDIVHGRSWSTATEHGCIPIIIG